MTVSKPGVGGIEFERRASREQIEAQHCQVELTCRLHQGQGRGKNKVSPASFAIMCIRPFEAAPALNTI